MQWPVSISLCLLMSLAGGCVQVHQYTEIWKVTGASKSGIDELTVARRPAGMTENDADALRRSEIRVGMPMEWIRVVCGALLQDCKNGSLLLRSQIQNRLDTLDSREVFLFPDRSGEKLAAIIVKGSWTGPWP